MDDMRKQTLYALAIIFKQALYQHYLNIIY